MEWINLNREKKREYSRNWRRDNPERAKEIRMKVEVKSRGRRIEYKSRMRKTPRWKYLVYVHSSKKHGRKMEITFEQYKEIAGKPCVYCGISGKTGMDRVDSGEGYTLSNVVPCCATCNRMKLAMTVDEFIGKCREIVARYDDRTGADFGAVILADWRF
jgi:hypothetical protein